MSGSAFGAHLKRLLLESGGSEEQAAELEERIANLEEKEQRLAPTRGHVNYARWIEQRFEGKSGGLEEPLANHVVAGHFVRWERLQDALGSWRVEEGSGNSGGFSTTDAKPALWIDIEVKKLRSYYVQVIRDAAAGAGEHTDFATARRATSDVRSEIADAHSRAYSIGHDCEDRSEVGCQCCIENDEWMPYYDDWICNCCGACDPRMEFLRELKSIEKLIDLYENPAVAIAAMSAEEGDSIAAIFGMVDLSLTHSADYLIDKWGPWAILDQRYTGFLEAASEGVKLRIAERLAEWPPRRRYKDKGDPPAPKKPGLILDRDVRRVYAAVKERQLAEVGRASKLNWERVYLETASPLGITKAAVKSRVRRWRKTEPNL